MSRPPLIPAPRQGQGADGCSHTIVASLAEQMDTLSPLGWAHLSPRFCGRHASPIPVPSLLQPEGPCPSSSRQLPTILRAPLTPLPRKVLLTSLPTHSASDGMTRVPSSYLTHVPSVIPRLWKGATPRVYPE